MITATSFLRCSKILRDPTKLLPSWKALERMISLLKTSYGIVTLQHRVDITHTEDSLHSVCQDSTEGWR